MLVKYAYLDREYSRLESEINSAVNSCLSRGDFILRSQVDEFESRICKMHGGLKCVSVNSGTDALNIMIKLSNIPKQSKIIVSAHTFVSSVSAITKADLIPVFCDINDNGNINADELEVVMDGEVRGILVTHMNGLMADMQSIAKFATKHDLKVFEDSAQAIGSKEYGNKSGVRSTAAAFSLHPLKTLGVAGDGGFIITGDEKLANHARAYRNLGQYVKGHYEEEGCNSRLDNIQAAIANIKMEILDFLIEERRRHAHEYCAMLSEITEIQLPEIPDSDCYFHTFSNFVIRCQKRDELKEWLTKNGVEVAIHWNPPVSSLDMFKGYRTKSSLCNSISYNEACLSLPISPWMTDIERVYVITKIKEFYIRIS
jgi:dTDP-4-amino-4,6-dideoxygalactose transaminase